MITWSPQTCSSHSLQPQTQKGPLSLRNRSYIIWLCTSYQPSCLGTSWKQHMSHMENFKFVVPKVGPFNNKRWIFTRRVESFGEKCGDSYNFISSQLHMLKIKVGLMRNEEKWKWHEQKFPGGTRFVPKFPNSFNFDRGTRNEKAGWCEACDGLSEDWDVKEMRRAGRILGLKLHTKSWSIQLSCEFLWCFPS